MRTLGLFITTRNQQTPLVIKALSDRIYAECRRHFIMRGISKIGAFYLPLGYQLEKEEETRLLIKSWGDGLAYKMNTKGEDYPYIPLKIGKEQNEFCDIQISRIYMGANCDRQRVREVLKSSPFHNVTLL